eukprot:4432723-Alexandrium_andersonii.AAC.1
MSEYMGRFVRLSIKSIASERSLASDSGLTKARQVSARRVSWGSERRSRPASGFEPGRPRA